MKYLKQKKKTILVTCLLIGLFTLICLFLYKPFITLFENPQALKQELSKFGIFGQLFMIMIMALQIVFAFLPGEIIEVMSGFLYGSIGGMFICMLGSFIGSTLVFSFVRKFGLRFITRFFRIEQIHNINFINDTQKRNILLFIIFFVPGTPKDILTYIMPLTDIKLSTFLFITTFARIPSIITSTVGGSAIASNQFSFSILIFTITGFISIIGIYMYRKINKQKEICNL